MVLGNGLKLTVLGLGLGFLLAIALSSTCLARGLGRRLPDPRVSGGQGTTCQCF